MKANYLYCLFELVIASEIEIPYLDKLQLMDRSVDVTIEIGKLPEIKEKIIKENSYSQISAHEYICHVEDIVSFYIGYGSKIMIEEGPKVDLEIVYLFLLGHVLAVLLGQRDIVAIHSSSVVFHQRAALICGTSGAGKSTTASMLLERGGKLLSDDLSVLKVGKDGVVRTYRGFPQQKLCPDVVKRLQIDTSNFKFLTYQKEKFLANRRELFIYKATPIVAIFEIKKVDSEALKIKELLGTEKLQAIMKNICLMSIKYAMGASNEYIKQLIKVAQQVSYFMIERPSDKFSGEEITDYIMEYLNEENDMGGKCI